MERLTQKQIQYAARTKRGALNVSIKKYLYLLQLTINQVRKLPADFLRGHNCGLCCHYLGANACPLGKCNDGDCIFEWTIIYNAHRRLRKPSQTDIPTEDYNTFISNVAQIYVRLLKIKGTI